MQSSLKDLNLNPRSAHNLNSTRNMSPVGYVLAFLIFFFFFLRTSLSLVRNLGCHAWVKHSSCKSCATHFCQCVQEQCCPFLAVCARAVLPISGSVCKSSAAHFWQCVQEQCCPFLAVCARAALPISGSVCKSSAAHFWQCVQEQRCPFLAVCARAALPISGSVCKSSATHFCQSVQEQCDPFLSVQEQCDPFLSVCARAVQPISVSVCKSSATHFCQCVQYFCVSRQWYGCQFWGFLMCAQTLIHAIVHGGWTDTIREAALEVNSGENLLPFWGLKPASALRLAFWLDPL